LIDQKISYFGDYNAVRVSDGTEVVTHCPCGKSKIKKLTSVERKSCLHPNTTCDKELKCGLKEERHRYTRKCHNV
jgi:hypothetical protein